MCNFCTFLFFVNLFVRKNIINMFYYHRMLFLILVMSTLLGILGRLSWEIEGKFFEPCPPVRCLIVP